MTKSERRQVAATLREWAAWCEASGHYWWLYPPYTRLELPAPCHETVRAAREFVSSPHHALSTYDHTGPTAATGLLLAAAAVEAGDMP
jgi:hypothetical protein